MNAKNKIFSRIINNNSPCYARGTRVRMDSAAYTSRALDHSISDIQRGGVDGNCVLSVRIQKTCFETRAMQVHQYVSQQICLTASN